MSIPGAFGSWLPWRELEGLLAAGRTLLPSLPTSPSGVLQTAIRTVGERLVGTRLTVRAADTDLRMTLVELDCRVSSVGLGQADVGDLRLVVEDIEDIGDSGPKHVPVRRAEILCRDVRVRSMPVPTLDTRSIELAITVDGEVVGDLVTRARPDVLADLGPDRVLRLRSARRPRWADLEVEPRIDGTRILLQPMAVRVSRLRVPLPGGVRPIPVDVPELPGGLRLTGIGTGEESLVLHGVTDRWRERLATIPLSTLLSAVTSAATTLTVPWLGDH